MYGVEWDQPAIVAMALAQACVHSDQFHDFLIEAETESKTTETPMPRIGELLREAAADAALVASPRLSDGNKVRDGVLARARPSALRLASKVRVLPAELDERTAEMYDAAIYIASGAALHGAKDPKYEFFLMHHVNVAPIFVTLNRQDWIPETLKTRMLEWKIRMDIIQYAARGSPALDIAAIRDYVPTSTSKSPASAEGLLPRMHAFVDDGHAIKLFRAVAIGREVCRPYQDADWMLIKGDDLWDQVAHMVVDSVEAPGPTWVRNAGFDEAWEVSFFFSVRNSVQARTTKLTFLSLGRTRQTDQQGGICTTSLGSVSILAPGEIQCRLVTCTCTQSLVTANCNKKNEPLNVAFFAIPSLPNS